MSIKYNEFGEVISVNGLTTGHHLGAPMQDAQAERPEDNEVYAIQHSTVTNCKNTIEDAKPKPGGASSWNDLEDKPFYEETTTVGGDTLTWDGNTEGLEDLAGSPVYRVSSAAPSIEDCAKGGTIKYSYNGQAMEGTFAAEDVVSAGVYFQIFTMGVGLVFVVPADTTVEGVTLHAGTYLINHNGAVVNSLTIPNSNAFVTTKTVVKPIETKYLPEHLHFGEEKAFEPIVWDGSAEGRETLEGGALVHISSQKINPAIIENLVFCNSETGERQAITDFQVRLPEPAPMQDYASAHP